jgi:Flp pilus assembly protein TadG
MLKKIHNERGTAAVLTTLALTALLGFTALVVDVGVWYVNRVQVSNAADAAVLAGAQDLPEEDKAGASADNYALLNGRAGDTVNLNFFDSDTTLTASVRRDVINLFSRVFAEFTGTTEVGATATAKIFTLGTTNAKTGVVPLGVVWDNFSLGQLYTLKVGGGGGSTGQYGALTLGGKSGATPYEDNLINGFQGSLHVGEAIPTETGNISGKTKSAIEARLNADQGATYNTVQQGSPRVVVLPVIDTLDVNGGENVTILGFAAFFLEGAPGSGKDSEITGRFIRMVLSGQGTTTGTNYGAFAAKLIN